MRLRGDGVNLEQVRALFLDHLARIIEATPALHFASEARISLFGRRCACAGRLADFGLADSIADAHDRAVDIPDNEKRSQLIIHPRR